MPGESGRGRATPREQSGNDRHHFGLGRRGANALLDRLYQLEPATRGLKRLKSGAPRPSECCPQARVESAGPRRTDGTWIRERRATIGKIGHGTGIKEGSVGCVTVVQNIIDASVNLKRLVDLIGGVSIEDGIRRQPRCLIGRITNK